MIAPVPDLPARAGKPRMHLFTRTRTINASHADDAHAVAIEMARYATATTGLEVIPWAIVYGGPVGTVSFSAGVDSQGAVGTALDTLAADDGDSQRLADSASRVFTGPVEDAIGEIVSIVGSSGNRGALASVTTARCAPGRTAEAMAWAIDILSHASKVTGLDGALVRSLYGPWATVAWIRVADTWEDIDASTVALAADSSYVERIDDGEALLLAGSVSRRLHRRLE
jgi:hypothetical protein